MEHGAGDVSGVTGEGAWLTDDEGLFEGGPRDVVPGRPAGGVDGPLVGPQQRRLRLALAGGLLPRRYRRGQRAAGRAVRGVVSAPTGVEDGKSDSFMSILCGGAVRKGGARSEAALNTDQV